jgi:hypothetical protein
VAQFLKRYRPSAVDPASSVTPAVSDAPWRLMLKDGVLPVAVGDVVRLMLESNLDVTVNRFAPLANRYSIDMLLRPFEPTLTLSATIGRSTQHSSSSITATPSVMGRPFILERVSISISS